MKNTLTNELSFNAISVYLCILIFQVMDFLVQLKIIQFEKKKNFSSDPRTSILVVFSKPFFHYALL